VIRVIAARELRSLYASPVAWVWLAVAIGLTAWMVFAQLESFQRIAPRLALVDGAPGLTDLVILPGLDAAGLVGLLLAPLVGMRLFSEEQRAGRFALLLSAPVSLRQLVLGKFAGALGLYAVLWVVVGALLASLGLGTSLDWGKLAVGLAGLALLYAAALALSLWLSTLTSQPAAAAAAAYGLLLLLWLAGNATSGNAGVVGALSLAARFQGLMSGVLRAADVAYFVIVVVVALALAVLRLETWRTGRGARRLEHWAVWLLTLLMLVAAGLGLRIAHRYGGAWDLSANARHSLSPASLAVVERLPAPIRFTVIAPEYGSLRAPAQILMERYRRARPDATVAFLDPDRNPEQARRLGVRQPVELLVEYDGRSERVGKVSEQAVTSALQRLAMRSERWVVGLAGHGEASLTGRANFDLGDFGSALVRAGYRVQPLTLADSGQVPRNTALLVLAAPQLELPRAEQKRLLDFLEEGGHLLWLLGDRGTTPASQVAAELGLQRVPGVIVDPAAATVGAAEPTVAVVARYPDHPAVGQLATLSVFPGAVALEAAPDDGWTATPLLQTGAQSWNETGPVKGEVTADAARGERRGPLSLGWALTRTRADGREQRMVVVGDADFLSSAVVGNAGNLELGLNLVRWLAQDDALLDIPPRVAPDRQLSLSRPAALTLAATFLIALPLASVVAGWWIRRRRRHA
jgi:ABC-type transport system involved in multi-copper enzyme maturation permease subunit/ABC-type uncharacterized transport system involved in gliding motility auxiliary subunit